MTSWLFIVEKMGTLLDEMIHITHGCAMHLHDHRNKTVSFMKLSILANFSNDIRFCNNTYWLSNDTQSDRLPCEVNNHHIANKNLIFSGHVEIDS